LLTTTSLLPGHQRTERRAKLDALRADALLVLPVVGVRAHLGARRQRLRPQVDLRLLVDGIDHLGCGQDEPEAGRGHERRAQAHGNGQKVGIRAEREVVGGDAERDFDRRAVGQVTAQHDGLQASQVCGQIAGHELCGDDRFALGLAQRRSLSDELAPGRRRRGSSGNALAQNRRARTRCSMGCGRTGQEKGSERNENDSPGYCLSPHEPRS
jgi:hypothetical protein